MEGTISLGIEASAGGHWALSKGLVFALWAVHEVFQGRQRSEYVCVVIWAEMREGQVKVSLVTRLPEASVYSQAAAIHHQLVQ